MDEFAYKNGEMHVETVPLSSIVKDIGSPVYIYSTREMVNAYKSFSEAFNEHNAKICFAVKSNSNLFFLNFIPITLANTLGVVSSLFFNTSVISN